jgi:hypothetical protein
MPSIKLPGNQIAQLTEWVSEYIGEQRTAFLNKAHPIGLSHKKILQSFFPADILDNTRVVRGRADEPSFYRQLQAMGIRNAPAFLQMAGITFLDVVVHVDPLTEPLLFHELVHAVQYKHLGLHGFAERYVRGFLTGGSYEEIPLEKQAYELEARFSANRASNFSVEADVQNKLRSKQL